MEAVSNHRSGSTRVRSLVIAVIVAVSVAVLIGLGASSGVLSGKRGDDASPHRGEVKPSQAAPCSLCGTVESIRSVEVYDELNTSGNAADPRNASANPGVGPGGEIANNAVSMLDSLSNAISGSAAEKSDKNIRKRLVWRVTLRMDDGSFRAVSLPSPPAFTVGEKVRVVEGRLVRA